MGALSDLWSNAYQGIGSALGAQQQQMAYNNALANYTPWTSTPTMGGSSNTTITVDASPYSSYGTIPPKTNCDWLDESIGKYREKLAA